MAGPEPGSKTISSRPDSDTGTEVQRQCSNCAQEDDDVQQTSSQGAASGQAKGAATVREIAAEGVAGSGSRLPHFNSIQSSFGKHDVSQVQAFVGGRASRATRAIHADAYATGGRIAFGKTPSLAIAAHEAAHVVQQRQGVQLHGGVGVAGDIYERNADAVAARVVQGRSAENLLGSGPSGEGATIENPAVQGFGLGDIFTGIKEGAKAVKEGAKTALNGVKQGGCDLLPNSATCVDDDRVDWHKDRDTLISDLEDVASELKLMKLTHWLTVFPRLIRGRQKSKTLLRVLMTSVNDLMAFKDEENLVTYSMFEQSHAEAFATNAATTIVGAIPAVGPALGFLLAEGLSAYSIYQSNSKLEHETDAAKYLSVSDNDIMIGLADILFRQNSLIYGLGTLDGKTKHIYGGAGAEILAIDKAIHKASSAESELDMARINDRAKQLTQQARAVLARSDQARADLDNYVGQISEAVVETKKHTKMAFRRLKTMYLNYDMGRNPVGLSGRLMKHLPSSGDGTGPNIQPDFQGRMYLDSQIAANQKAFWWLSPQTREHFFKQSPRRLSKDGAELTMTLRIGHHGGAIGPYIPGYKGSPPAIANVTISTTDGVIEWKNSTFHAKGVLSALGYGSFSGKHPELGEKLRQRVIETIQDKPISQFTHETLEIPLPRLGPRDTPSGAGDWMCCERVIGGAFQYCNALEGPRETCSNTLIDCESPFSNPDGTFGCDQWRYLHQPRLIDPA